MVFPRHDARENPPSQSQDEISELTLKSDLLDVMNLFEEVMVHFLTERLIKVEVKKIGNEHLISLNNEKKIQLLNKLMESLTDPENHDLQLTFENVIRRLKNAQLFRNVAAHGGKFRELEGGKFTWTGIKEPKQPRNITDIEEIMGNKAFDLIDDLKYFFSQV